jgi:hypothetical protein
VSAIIRPRASLRRTTALSALLMLCARQSFAQVPTTTPASSAVRQAVSGALLRPAALSEFSSARIQLGTASPSNEPSSVSFLGTLERFSLLKEARSVRTVNLSLDVASKAALRSPFELLGKKVVLTYYALSEGLPRSEYFGFRTVDSQEPIYLAADVASHSVTGYALLDHRSYEIRPVKEGGSSHLLVEIPQLPPYREGTRVDAGDPEAGDSTHATLARTSASRAPTTSPTALDCSREHRAITVSAPLRIVFGFTAQADREARRSGAVFIRDQMHLDANGLEESLREAGITVEVRLINDGLRINYQEPGLAGDDPLKAEVVATTDSQDPELVSLRDLRKQLHGDIQVLIVNHDDDGSCGWARNIGVEAPQASVVVSYHCMTRKFTVMHEISHLLGARHDDDPTLKPPFALAFVHDTGEEPFVTLTGKDVDCRVQGTCARIMKLSDPYNSEIVHEKDVTGAVHDKAVTLGIPNVRDNACVVRQNIRRVVQFGDSL